MSPMHCADCCAPQVPEFRVSMSIETDKFDALYKRLKPHGVTMTALLAKAVAAALSRHPVLFACERDGHREPNLVAAQLGKGSMLQD